MEDVSRPRATGRCLCGAVTFEVHGLLRDVILCHCIECRRWSGTGAGAFTAARNGDLVIAGDALRWTDSPDSKRRARRGFCGECGSSLFWKAADAERTSIAAGTLDEPTRLGLAGHIYTHQVADWDARPADGLPTDDGVDSNSIRWS